ncbi:uncharacterized protein [Hetaerina americana]|uniref:uncharacterized protein n=1 Tax=Hetaerina americana TaxID=62018 RepID=UPI003A7F1620
MNEDKASKAIKYLSHLSQRQGIALVQPKTTAKEQSSEPLSASVESSPKDAVETEVNEEVPMETETQAEVVNEKEDGRSSPTVNPPKRTYSRPRSDPVVGALKWMLGENASSINSALAEARAAMDKVVDQKASLAQATASSEPVERPKEVTHKVKPKTVSEMLQVLKEVSCKREFGELKEVDVPSGDKVKPPGLKRSALDGSDGSGQSEPKQFMLGSKGADVEALLKTLDPSNIQKIHIKHPKTGKDVLVTKITAPNPTTARAQKLSPDNVKAMVSSSPQKSTPKKKVTFAPTVVQPVKQSGDNSKTVMISQAVVTVRGQQGTGNAKVYANKDSKGSFPLLVPVDAIDKVTKSSNLLIKHPVTGKGIIVSKLMKKQQASSGAPKPNVESGTVPGSNAADRESTERSTVVPAGGTKSPGLAKAVVGPTVLTSEPSTATVNVVTDDGDECVGREDVGGEVSNYEASFETFMSPQSPDVDGLNEETGDYTEVQSESNSAAPKTAEGSSGTPKPEAPAEETGAAPNQHQNETSKADEGKNSEKTIQSSPNLPGNLKKVTEVCGTAETGDIPAKPVPGAKETDKETMPSTLIQKTDNSANQGGVVKVIKEESKVLGVPVPKEASVPKTEGGSTVSESVVSQILKQATSKVNERGSIPSEELVQQILQGVAGKMASGTHGILSNAVPAMWEGGKVRTLNIGGKTVKVILVKDEDYEKMLSKSVVSGINPTTSLKGANAVPSAVTNVAPSMSIAVPSETPKVVSNAVEASVVSNLGPKVVSGVVEPNVVSKVVPGVIEPSTASKLVPKVGSGTIEPSTASKLVPKLVSGTIEPSVVPKVVSGAIEPSTASKLVPKVVSGTIEPCVVPKLVPKVVTSAVEPSAAPKLAPKVVSRGVEPSLVPKLAPKPVQNLAPKVSPNVVSILAPSMVPIVAPIITSSLVPIVASTVVPVMTNTVVPSVMPIMAPRVVPNVPTSSIGKPIRPKAKTEVHGHSSRVLVQAVDNFANMAQRSGPSHTPRSISILPKKENNGGDPGMPSRGFLGFPSSPRAKATGLLGTNLGNYISTVQGGSTKMATVAVPQNVVSVQCPTVGGSKMIMRKPNILSSATRTVASTVGRVTVTQSISPSVAGVKQGSGNMLETSPSRLKVRPVEETSISREFEKKQHPLVKAALSGRPMDFKEELGKLDPEDKPRLSDVGRSEGNVTSETSIRKSSHGTDGNSSSIASVKTTSVPEVGASEVTESISIKNGVRQSTPSVRVCSIDSLREPSLIPNIVSQKISNMNVLSSVASAESEVIAGISADGVSIPLRSKRKQEFGMGKLGKGIRVEKSVSSGMVGNKLGIVVNMEVDDCVIIKEVETRESNPPEVFNVDSND